MKKFFKFGFTLPEVLIALSIAGVIAALVIPPLATTTQNNKNAAALGRSVEVIETGCQMLIQRANELSSNGEFFGHYDIALSDIGINSMNTVSGSGLIFNNASEFFNTTPLTSEQVTSYKNMVKNYNGTTPPNPPLNEIVENYALNPRLGAYYGVSDHYAESTNDDEITEIIYIDVNGTGSPNRYGIDIFLFGLTDRCNMVPAGSQRVKNVFDIGGIVSMPLSTEACDDHVDNGLSCTERVVREGYKNNYKR